MGYEETADFEKNSIESCSDKQMKKLCFASSSGGHYEQILMLKPLMEKYDSFLMTEKIFWFRKSEDFLKRLKLKRS